ncbi:MAG: type IV toxin-antitoxin system AbiEi family antitoxin, partial [Bacteroidota bacterium]|nr:type IV toxin-antitoxin system AbiEi family antitoxin [Bacteroidota bacterium]
MKEKILITAFQNLEEITGIKAKWENIPPYYVDKGYDIKVKLKLKKRTISLYAVVKKEIREHQVLNVLELLNQNKNVILIAENIFPKIREKLRKLEIGYLDINGNMFYTNDDNYVFIETHRKQQTTVKKVRVFTKTGLKLLFTILNEPNLINVPYRIIANEANVALGTVNNFMKGLKELGYITEIDKNYKKIRNFNDLIEKWTNEYNHKLKPNLHIGNYRFLYEKDYNNWKDLDFKTKNTCWGGEPAADIITNYLRP